MDSINLVDKNGIHKLKKMRGGLILLAIVCFGVAGLFFYKGNDVKNNYYNSEKYPKLNQNAYVGGDAYNYIINGTYFTGYSVVASSLLMCGMLAVNGAVNVTVKIIEKEK